jgi:rare lipoprotein A
VRDAGVARFVRCGLAAGVIAAAGAVAACATSDPHAAGGPAALFRTQVGHASEAVAPGLRSAWYIERGPVLYAKAGTASWRPARPAGAWLARLFRRRGEAPPPVAVADLASGLPAPALVMVTSLKTFRTITVRVDEKARLGGAIIRLPAEAAQALGADPGQPLAIRLRYLAPVHAYREPPTLRYALRGAIRGAPEATSPVLLAQASPPVLVAQRVSGPAPGELRSAPAVDFTPRLRGAIETPSGAFQVQAGAFAQRANAERALVRLAPAGRADIVPLKRGGETLYRVVLAAPSDAGGAERLRARVAGIGFSDAQVIRPL